MDSRLEEIRVFLKTKKVDAMLLSSPISIGYYTSFQGFSQDEREGYALITKKHVHLLTSPLYEGTVSRIENVLVKIYTRERPIGALMQEITSGDTLTTVAVEQNNLTLSEYLFFKKLFKIIPANIRHLRNKKSENEIQAIQKACGIADDALARVKPLIETGMTETEIAMLLATEMRKHADISFRPIVAFSENAAIPHHVSKSNKKLKADDSILIDFGAKWGGYCSDMTRTFFHGPPNDEQKKVYEIVFSAQKAAVDYLTSLVESRQIIKASAVDQVARDYIVSKGYPTIPHSLGHGIGLEVHEPPFLGPGSKDVLGQGMVFSIEPGIYLPGKFGVRIEDLFTISDGKLLQLTNYPK